MVKVTKVGHAYRFGPLDALHERDAHHLVTVNGNDAWFGLLKSELGSKRFFYSNDLL